MCNKHFDDLKSLKIFKSARQKYECFRPKRFHFKVPKKSNIYEAYLEQKKNSVYCFLFGRHSSFCLKAGDVTSSFKGRQIRKYRISLEI